MCALISGIISIHMLWWNLHMIWKVCNTKNMSLLLLFHVKNTGCVNSWLGSYFFLFQNMNSFKKMSEISAFGIIWQLKCHKMDLLRTFVTSNSSPGKSHGRLCWSSKVFCLFLLFHFLQKINKTIYENFFL